MLKSPKTLLGKHWKKIIDDLNVYKKSSLERGIKDKTDEIKQVYGEYCSLKRQIDTFSLNNSNSNHESSIPEIIDLKKQLRSLENQLCELAYQLPNNIHMDTPIGAAEHNKIVGYSHNLDEILNLNREKKETKIDHVKFYERINAINFDKAASISGSKFIYLLGQGALLELALVQFALQKCMNYGYTPVIVPEIVDNKIIKSCGYMPRSEKADLFYTLTGKREQGLIATSEIPLAALHSNECIPRDALPIKYVGLSHCFRPETGNYGAESRGLYRLHQFTKVEMFVLCSPEFGDFYLQEILTIQKDILDSLTIPYRVLMMSSQELGLCAYQKFDIEGWFPSRSSWGELTSASNCTDYQSARLNIEFKLINGISKHVYTLNGTALAIPRILQNIAEKNEKLESLNIPDALKPFMLKSEFMTEKTQSET